MEFSAVQGNRILDGKAAALGARGGGVDAGQGPAERFRRTLDGPETDRAGIMLT
jgi:hypothetical protein